MQKEKVLQVVETLPENIDVDELTEKLYLLEKIEAGEREIARGEGIPHDEARRRLERWLR
jgi:hypothetical protein